MESAGSRRSERMTTLSVIMPARDEQACIATTVGHLSAELRRNLVPHEILVVDDGSTDQTWQVLTELESHLPALRALQNPGPYGFGQAVRFGLDHMAGDAAVIMMADESDDCRDVVRYWGKLNEGFDCVFGSRFIKGGSATGYPLLKYVLNRLANHLISLFFGLAFDDTTNAFKGYHKRVLDGCRPFRASQFDLSVELPLKAFLRGYSWTVVPVAFTDRRAGTPKFSVRRMAMPYLSTLLTLWLEHACQRVSSTRPASRP